MSAKETREKVWRKKQTVQKTKSRVKSEVKIVTSDETFKFSSHFPMVTLYVKALGIQLLIILKGFLKIDTSVRYCCWQSMTSYQLLSIITHEKIFWCGHMWLIGNLVIRQAIYKVKKIIDYNFSFFILIKN